MAFYYTRSCKIINCLLTFYFLIISLACYTQINNNIRQDDFFYISGNIKKHVSPNSIQQIDSIAHTTGIASHFAKVYSQSMGNIAIQMQKEDSGANNFIKQFEIGFAGYFLDACMEEKDGNFSPAPVWKCYFSSIDAQPWQMVLLGVNAHINGEMWRALVENFSQNDIRRYKKQFLELQLSVAKLYNPFFDTIMVQNNYLRFINGFTKGLARKFGERVVYKWRRRQVQLAILFYHAPEKFRKRQALVNRKKQRVDQLILRK